MNPDPFDAEKLPGVLRKRLGLHRVRGLLEHRHALEYIPQATIMRRGELDPSDHTVYRVIDTRARLTGIGQIAMRHDGGSRLVYEPFDPLADSTSYASKLKSRHSSSTGLDLGDR